MCFDFLLNDLNKIHYRFLYQKTVDMGKFFSLLHGNY